MAPAMSGDEEPVTKPVEQALGRARARLHTLQGHEPFSESAYQTLERSIDEYIRSLVLESARTATRQRADVVSSTDVEQAARYLYRGSNRSIVQHVGTIGGILVGAAVGNVLALIDGDAPSVAGLLFTAALLLVGAVMITIHVVRDIR